MYADEEAARSELCRVAGAVASERIVREAASFEEGNDTLMDRPLDFAARRFAPRRVEVGDP